MKKLSFVIPCYYSSKTILKVVEEILHETDKHQSFDYEIILVNDGSKDDTFQVIKSICKENKKIKGVNLAQNFGQASATLAAFHFVTGDIIVYSDDDGQTPIENTFSLINKLEEGYDVVWGKFEDKKNSFFQNLGSRSYTFMLSYLLNKPKDLHFGNLWVSKRFVVDECIKCNNPFPNIAGLFLSITKNMTHVIAEHRKRVEGSSNYTFKKMIGLWMNGFIGFSVKPLRIATFTGIITSLIGFTFGIYLIINKIINPKIAIGYSSIMVTILFIGGMILMLMGLIGEYIGRIYININNVPQFVIKTKVNIDN